MVNAYRRIDALGLYLSGASSNGGAQTDPSAALGNFRSSTEVSAISGIVTNPIPPLVFEKYSDANGTGEATLRGAGDTVYYTPPGGTEGAGVAIASGERCIVYGADTTKWVRVYRESAVGIVGTVTLALVRGMNGLLGMDNVTSAERAAGAIHYRAGMLYAHGAFGVLDLAIWLDNSNCQSTYAIGLEAPAADAIQTIANDETAPAAVSFSTPTTEGAGLSIPVIDVGGVYGLWIRRTFPGAGIHAVEEYPILHISYWGA